MLNRSLKCCAIKKLWFDVCFGKKIKFTLLENLEINDNEKQKSRNIKIPVCCDDKYGLDFERLSNKLNLNKREILKIYFSKDYFCYMTGFIAGMPFLGDLTENMRAKRLETPRVKVPKGSVALTEQFANIYTFESPGGWNVIGNSPLTIFDSSKETNPNLINPGDIVLFKEISKKQYENYNE